ncbi:alpha/beta hydrolase [Chondromyces crocatus]|uniref:Alpha/beta hydrolase n=1 Tax=Chondromyces crocatus TaxID=52 RepID=A0A0K1EJS1_CHOCO|nr:alpha/beta hydrolase [Chondromyces crocatus]AKT40848.1 uncharacterized protein CMC5_050030 [Chondromyces crocatus]
MGPKRDQPRVLTPRQQRQAREALALLASVAVILIALAARQSTGATPTAPASQAPLHATLRPPSPLPSGATPERITTPDPEMEPSCSFPDRGFGAYGDYRSLPFGKILVPPAGAIPAGGHYDLLIHFHGAEPVRREIAPLDLGLVIAVVDAGTRSSDYARAMRTYAWEALLGSIDRVVAEAASLPEAHVKHVAVSSWSAGSGAVAQILTAERKPDALVLLDSLYGGYAPGHRELIPGQLGPYVSLAEAASRGGPLLFLTHTTVPTVGYASTEETATFLLRQLGASASLVTPNDGDPLRLVRMYDGGSLYLRGYAGATREDHCAQLRLLPTILTEHILPAFAQGS